MVFRGFVLGTAFALAGCAGSPPDSAADASSESPPSKGGLFSGLIGQRAPATPLVKTEMAGGDIVLVGPSGYCIDKSSLTNRRNRGFALLASCRILTDGAAGPVVEPALLSVTVTPMPTNRQVPSPQEIALAADAPLLDGKTSNGVAMAHLGDAGDSVVGTGDPNHWRAAFAQNGHLIGIALYAPAKGVMAGRAGASMIANLAQSIKTQSPSRQSEQSEDNETKTKSAFSLIELFKRRDSQ